MLKRQITPKTEKINFIFFWHVTSGIHWKIIVFFKCSTAGKCNGGLNIVSMVSYNVGPHLLPCKYTYEDLGFKHAGYSDKLLVRMVNKFHDAWRMQLKTE